MNNHGDQKELNCKLEAFIEHLDLILSSGYDPSGVGVTSTPID